mmetsp:Transcript_143919/g.261855  ORF Transcript_143919/g.261855 Transcript_143919/m.261855 type:complete len:324 (-) Transcript_143919:2528-3499(-)
MAANLRKPCIKCAVRSSRVRAKIQQSRRALYAGISLIFHMKCSGSARGNVGFASRAFFNCSTCPGSGQACCIRSRRPSSDMTVSSSSMIAWHVESAFGNLLKAACFAPSNCGSVIMRTYLSFFAFSPEPSLLTSVTTKALAFFAKRSSSSSFGTKSLASLTANQMESSSSALRCTPIRYLDNQMGFIGTRVETFSLEGCVRVVACPLPLGGGAGALPFLLPFPAPLEVVLSGPGGGDDACGAASSDGCSLGLPSGESVTTSASLPGVGCCFFVDSFSADNSVWMRSISSSCLATLVASSSGRARPPLGRSSCSFANTASRPKD